MLIKAYIRTIPDYPKKGIQFRDITTLLKNPKGLRITIDQLVQRYLGQKIDCIVGIEARGFIFGSVLAYKLGLGFIPIRKAGKLPSETIKQCYQLEYGEDCLEIHTDSIKKGDRVLLIDDLIATGGTAEAAVKLIHSVGGKVHECCFIVDLPDLGGIEKLAKLGCDSFSLCQFKGE